MSDEIRQRRATRRRFLEFLYRASEEEASEYRDGYEVAEELEIPRRDAERIVRYLEDHGFLTKSGGMGMVVRITARGIDHVERSTSDEDGE
jgi:DNA-binding MarR family transcriptional regulator